MKAFGFLFQISIIVLLWASIWGLLEILIETICEDNRKKRIMTYLSIIVFLIILYTVNPTHFNHA